ncbi:MAG: hypothetical protein JWP44_4597, partial [Mucilaginibacter sp.]|nr:hypothetical protein [Mucilaginibacter sp.]
LLGDRRRGAAQETRLRIRGRTRQPNTRTDATGRANSNAGPSALQTRAPKVGRRMRPWRQRAGPRQGWPFTCPGDIEPQRRLAACRDAEKQRLSWMSFDPALDAHEHREHAEHAAHAGDPFISRVSITIAVLAVLAAAAGSLETLEAGGAITASSEAVLAQDRATDLWAEYQADSLKKHLYGLAADGGGPNAPRYKAVAADDVRKQNSVARQASGMQTERDQLLAASRRHEARHHWLTAAATLLEIAIAICTVAIITRKRAFWFGSLGLGGAGLLLLASAYLL